MTMDWKDKGFKESICDEYAIIGRLQKIKDWLNLLNTHARNVVRITSVAHTAEEGDENVLRFSCGFAAEALTTIMESCEEVQALLQMAKERYK